MLLTMPRLTASRASSAGVQWLTGTSLSFGCSHASAMMSVTCSGEKVVGPPERRPSDNTSQISRLKSRSDAPCASALTRRISAAAHRSRHRRTRCRSTPNRFACRSLGSAVSDVRTIRARTASPSGVRRARDNSSRTNRCRCETRTSVALLGTIKPSGRSRQTDPLHPAGQVFRCTIPAGQV